MEDLDNLIADLQGIAPKAPSQRKAARLAQKQSLLPAPLPITKNTGSEAQQSSNDEHQPKNLDKAQAFAKLKDEQSDEQCPKPRALVEKALKINPAIPAVRNVDNSSSPSTANAEYCDANGVWKNVALSARKYEDSLRSTPASSALSAGPLLPFGSLTALDGDDDDADDNGEVGNSIQFDAINLHAEENDAIYISQQTPSCFTCNEEIAGPSLSAAGHQYHPEHFRCQGLITIKGKRTQVKCSRPLAAASYFEKSGLIMCEKCCIESNCPICKFCNETIRDRCINALDATFHPEHFFCGQCGKVFDMAEGAGYMEYKGKAYCKEDYATLFANECSGCKQPLIENYLQAAGGMWHQGCFACVDCKIPFAANDSFYEHDGLTLCEQHYCQRRSIICQICSKPIIGRCVNALGKRYHEEHFKCSFCQKALDVEGINGFKGHDGKPFCTPCHLKLYE